jgi:oligosaccharide repeat unit polymerase
MFAAAWTGAIALPLVGAPNFPVWSPAVWLIVLFVAAFGIAALWGERLVLAGDQTVVASAITPPRTLRAIALLGAFLGLAAVQLLLAVQDKTLIDLAHLSTWLEVAATYSLARYQEDISEPLGARLLSVGFYLGSLAGGLLWQRPARRMDRLWAAAPVIVALLYAAVLTTRAVFLYAAILFLSAAFSGRVHGGTPLLRLIQRRSVLLVLAGASAVFVMAVALQLARGGLDDLSRVPEVIDHLRAWFFGHLPAFSGWLRRYSPLGEPLHLGQRTLGGIFQVLGIQQRARGVFTEVFDLGSGHETNIYTAFRGLIEDFGIPGALGSMLVVGAVGGILYGQAARGRSQVLPLLSVIYCYILWSPVASFLSYNSILLAFLIFWIITRLTVREPMPDGPDAVPSAD